MRSRRGRSGEPSPQLRDPLVDRPPTESSAGPAPGAPGIAPTWSSSAKDAVGTSHFAGRVWFTVGRGIVNEVYWPRIDHPQVRDLGFIVADDEGFWSEVKRGDVETEVAFTRAGIPAVEVTHRHARYVLRLRICADDHADVLRIEARLKDRGAVTGPGRIARSLRLYPLLAPHLGVSGLDNRAWTGTYKGQPMLFAQSGSASLALASDPPPARQSVGYVGYSDGWQDFDVDGRMTLCYSATEAGNVAGMLEVIADDVPVRLALGFGDHPEAAALQASAALVVPFDVAWAEYTENWRRFMDTCTPPPEGLDAGLADRYLDSAAILRCHMDRAAPGATVASLSIPWGNTRDDVGGYHLVWSRDLVESAGAFIALGARASAQRALGYLVATQEPDGHWPQNQWIDGTPYWGGIQLDEAAYPILLAGAIREAGATHMHGRPDEAEAFEHLVRDHRLDVMIRAAAGFIARTGPVTEQDRWEETAGLTPSTLAPVIAALVVAADQLPEPAASYCRELADDWNASIEDWTFASGSRLAREHGVDGHYVRIASAAVLEGAPITTAVPVRNRPADGSMVPAHEMVGTDYLALVRFGLRLPDDPAILSTLIVADALLRTDTPYGPIWHRYNGDGYGEHMDGSAYDGIGIGRGWPLLTGERGHYELAAGRDPRPYLEAMCRLGSAGGMLPEQSWDAADIPERGLVLGRPSGSAMPLAWAHAEYVKLVRSMALGHAIDRPSQVWERYHGERPRAKRATWRFGARRPTMIAGRTLRFELLAPCRVRYSLDAWGSFHDVDAGDTGLGVWVADIPGSAEVAPGGAVEATFFWPEPESWEGANVRVEVVSG